MSLGQCPKCGKFLSDLTGYREKYGGLGKVTGVCKTHKIQDVSNQDWDYEDFFQDSYGSYLGQL